MFVSFRAALCSFGKVVLCFVVSVVSFFLFLLLFLAFFIVVSFFPFCRGGQEPWSGLIF